MKSVLSVEELIINDSFISYCNRDNIIEINRWESYLLQHPHEREIVEEAKAFVLGLMQMLKLSEKEKGQKRLANELQVKTPTEENTPLVAIGNVHTKNKKNYWLYGAASIAAMAIVWFGIIKINNSTGQNATVEQNVTHKETTPLIMAKAGKIQTKAGEKRVVYLPDGTKVTLNSKTTLLLDSTFGRNARVVKLDGEAFFDVVSNPQQPFIVSLNAFDIRVLGTMFNVMSYSSDKASEASLVKGKVEIRLKNESDKLFFLKPNEKVIVPNSSMNAAIVGNNNRQLHAAKHETAIIKPLNISLDGSSVAETLWIQNRFEINDETFEEMKNKIERKFNVEITFAEEEVKQYRFTATFEKENIDQILKVLQLSYSFHFTKNNNQIMIKK